MAGPNANKQSLKHMDMEKKYRIKIQYILLMMLLFSLHSCTDDNEASTKEGGLLRMGATFATQTRLAELPTPEEMAVDHLGLKNIGVYIYYTDDYQNGDLSQPYIRNMEFTVQGEGELLAASGTGTDQQVYIYDRMTIVAFYPYNAEMSNPENYFTVKADEEKYPITRSDYSQQLYIPYRAQTNTDPSIAYYTSLTFAPKHTYKVEVVVVAEENATLPNSGNVEILPKNDPTTTTDTTVDGKREQWFDYVNVLSNDGTGSFVQQYVTYIWTRQEDRNEIKRGDILLQSDDLTLIASQDLFPDEQHVYRYGYNMSTGEIFIPTSSRLINDQSSLSSLDGGNGNSYQVCDIHMTGNWTPISLYNARYDGGGHKIEDMVINSNSTEVGLFAQVQGNSTVANVDLVNPQITSTADSAYVGGLVGRLNTPMTAEEKQDLIGNLPPGLSPIVREALIQAILENAGNSQANIVASKVENPVITVTGQDTKVGGFVGQAGEKTEDGNSKSRIWDSAVLGGTISVNAGNPANNENAYVGGFVGLNQGYIGRSYTTTANITAEANEIVNGNTVTVDKYTGFTTMGTDFTPDEGAVIEAGYSQLPDPNNGITQFANGWPSFSTYTGNWPVDITGWLSGPGTSFWYSNGAAPDNYPILQWERR